MLILIYINAMRRMMKIIRNILIGLSGIFLAITLIIGWSFYSAVNMRNQLGHQITTMLTDTAEHNWNGMAMSKYASPSMQKILINPQYKDFAHYMRKLGTMEKFNNNGIFDIYNDNTIKISGVAHFENGDAVISMYMAKHDNKWMIEGIKAKVIKLDTDIT